MAMRDQNNNGKDDAFDMIMDYQLYRHTFGKDDDGDNTHDRSVQEDYYGIAEMSGKGTEAIL